MAQDQGFSLLESLVALAILAISLGAITGIFATALRNAAEADAVTRATLAGESLLNHVGGQIPLAAGVSSGELDGRLHWQVTTTPFYGDEDLTSWQMPLRAYWVEIEISWDDAGRRRAVALATLRLTPDPGLSL